MNYDQIISQKIQNIKPSGIRKFFDILEEMTDAISLGIGEPDFVTPWHIRDAGIYSLERGHTKYTSNAGMLELRREINRVQKELDAMRRRDGELSALFKRLYEDNVLGRVTNEQFRMLSAD